MQFIDWLFARTPDDHDDAPLPPAAEVGSPQPDITDDDAEPDRGTTVPLEPVFTVIDYTDATGTTTRRRITMRTLAATPSGATLKAICHERHAPRAFRCDRIRCFIDPDGQVIATPDFFRDILQIDLATYQPQATTGMTDSARAAREWLGPALSVLVAVARSDEELHPKELEQITDFARAEFPRLTRELGQGTRLSEKDIWAIRNTIERMRPTRSSLREHLTQIAGWSEDRRARLAAMLDDVIAADGVVRASEVEIHAEIVALRHQIGNGMWPEAGL